MKNLECQTNNKQRLKTAHETGFWRMTPFFPAVVCNLQPLQMYNTLNIFQKRMMTRSTQATPMTLRKSNLETSHPSATHSIGFRRRARPWNLCCRQCRSAAFWRFLVTLFLLKGAFRGILPSLLQRENKTVASCRHLMA